MRTAERRLARIRDRLVGPTALVLIYHRVARLDRDPQALSVDPTRFDEQVAFLAERHRVLSLGDLAQSLTNRKLHDRSIAITFDDGYADNLTTAEPTLAKHGLPATVYVSSGHVETGREFWWDQLERYLLSPGVLPKHIELEADGRKYSTDLEGSDEYSEADAQRDRKWTVLAGEANARQRVYQEISSFVRPLSPLGREQVLGQLRAMSESEGSPLHPHARSTHRPLTAEEVVRLDASPFVEVGGHTRDHPVLSACSLDEQRRQILEDRDALAALCGRSISTFSYPYGSPDDYTDETVGLVRELGFQCACSNHPGTIKPWTDPFKLPRMLVRDWDAETLAEKIEGWFRGRL